MGLYERIKAAIELEHSAIYFGNALFPMECVETFHKGNEIAYGMTATVDEDDIIVWSFSDHFETETTVVDILKRGFKPVKGKVVNIMPPVFRKKYGNRLVEQWTECKGTVEETIFQRDLTSGKIRNKGIQSGCFWTEWR